MSFVCRSEAKGGRTPLLNANNPPGRILSWESMALRESALNGYRPNGKVLVGVFLEKCKILKGERGKPIY